MDATMATATAPPSTALNSNLNSGGSSSSSSGSLSGSQCSNSSSSGYGSATTTPTTPIAGNYESPLPSTPVALAEPIPLAAVATVSPYYSEATSADLQQRQQYHQSYAYHPAAQTQPFQQYNMYDSYASSNYQSSTVNRHTVATAATPIEKLTAHASKLPANMSHISSGSRYKDAIISESNASAKPQATATPFYAKPLHSITTPPAGYFDPYKYKVPTKLSNAAADYVNYGNHLQNVAVAASYQQQQYYAAAKSQLQDAGYATAVKPLATTNPSSHSIANTFYPSNNGNSATYYEKYEKYMYAPKSTGVLAGAPTYAPTHYTTLETPAESYRKTTSSWHWNMEYAGGQYNTLPAPPSNIPTATVPPTNASYPKTRETSYAFGKCSDKYNAYYQQQYMPTGATATRPMWPNTHLTPLTERMSHAHAPQATAPPPTHAHHFPTNAVVRQNCCSQPYQQQNCYYPSNLSQQNHYVPSGNGSSKYGSGINDYSLGKMKTPNDLFAAPQYDSPPAHVNFGYATPAGQRYMTSAQQPSSALAPTVAAESTTAYYNDLSLPPTYDSYASTVQQTQYQQHMAASHAPHLPYPPAQNYAKSSLLGYRKPSSAQNSTTDCFLPQPPMAHMQDHASSRYSDYVANVNATALYNDSNNNGNVETVDKSSGVTKIISLRDFLSTWNEDEEEYAGQNDELAFIENESQATEQLSQPPYALDGTLQPSVQLYNPQSSAENHMQYKSSFNTRPKIHVGITLDSSTVDVETNQYINLPDIIIDIEKSSNVTSSTTATSIAEATASDLSFSNFDVEKELDELQSKKAKLTAEQQLASDGQSLVSDVKNITKEHDPLDRRAHSEKTLKVTPESQYTDNNEPELMNLTTSHCESKTKAAENLSDNVGQHVSATLPTNVSTEEHDTVFDNPEQFLKDIECDNTTDHSNESTFEKEYETFINKIGDNCETAAEEDLKDLTVQKAECKLSPETNDDVDDSNSQEDENEFNKNVKTFSKFYKRKRKLIEENEDSDTQLLLKNMKPSSLRDMNAVNTLKSDSQVPSLPIDYSKIRRKSRESQPQDDKEKLNTLNKRRLYRSNQVLYKILRSLRRSRSEKRKIDTSNLVQQRIAVLRDRRLPLIKRQSIKIYTAKSQQHQFNPKTLKCLSVCIMNTEAFRQRILRDIHRHKYNIRHSKYQRRIPSDDLKHIERDESKLYKKSIAEEADEVVDLTKMAIEGNINENQDTGGNNKQSDDDNDVDDLANMNVDSNMEDNQGPDENHKRSDDETDVKNMDVQEKPKQNQVPGANDQETNNHDHDVELAYLGVKENLNEINSKDEHNKLSAGDDYVDDPANMDAEEHLKQNQFEDSCHKHTDNIDNLADMSVEENLNHNPGESDDHKQTNDVDESSSLDVEENLKQNQCQKKTTADSDETIAHEDDTKDYTDASSSSESEDDEGIEADTEKYAEEAETKEQTADDSSSESDDGGSEYETGENAGVEQTKKESIESDDDDKESRADIDKQDGKEVEDTEVTDESSSSESDDDADDDEEGGEANIIKDAKDIRTEAVVFELSPAQTRNTIITNERKHHISMDLDKADLEQPKKVKLTTGTKDVEREISVSAAEEEKLEMAVEEKENIKQAQISEEEEEEKPEENVEETEKSKAPQISPKDAKVEMIIAKEKQIKGTQISDDVEAEERDETKKMIECEMSHDIYTISSDSEDDEHKRDLSAAVIVKNGISSEHTIKNNLDVPTKQQSVKDHLERTTVIAQKSNLVSGEFRDIPNFTDKPTLTSTLAGYKSPFEETNLFAQASNSSNIKTKASAKIYLDVDDDSSNSSTTSSSSSNTSATSDSDSSQSHLSSDDDTSSSTSINRESDDFNEFKALERELSQQKSSSDFEGFPDADNELTLNILNQQTGKYIEENEEVSKHDIAHVKQMLESDYEEHDDVLCKAWQTGGDVKRQSGKSDTTDNIDNREITICLVAALNRDEGKDVLMMTDETEQSKGVESEVEVANLESMTATELPRRTETLHSDVQKPVDDQNENPTIPKLSDLCKNALNSTTSSSEETSKVTINDNRTDHNVNRNNVVYDDSPNINRELTVEEALAEMYRQVGVTSDPEEYDEGDDAAKEGQHDVLLINLEEILDSDSNLYVVQCDMNENILSVPLENAEQVNTLQLVEILNATSASLSDDENDDVGDGKNVSLQVINENGNDTFTITSIEPLHHQLLEQEQQHSFECHDDSLTSQFDLPSLHHEEIVPDNYKKFEKEKFLKYLHEKYVQKNLTKFHHANCILKKYKRRLAKKLLNALDGQQEVKREFDESN